MLKNISEVTATFDGVSYTLTVDHDLREYEWEAMIGSSDPSYNDYPFLFIADVNYDSDSVSGFIYTQTAGPHTLKVEGAPSGDEPSDLRVLFTGRPVSASSTNVGNFIQFELPAENLETLGGYSNVTLLHEYVGYAKLPVIAGDNGSAYAGGDAYPPTSLIDPPNMMVYYTEDDGSNTPRAYVLFERPSGIWQVPNIVIAVDPNDKRKQ